METMPIAKGVQGEGALLGNRLDVAFKGGTIGSVDIYDGEVVIPVILPFGGDLLVKANGGGQVSSLIEVANSPPFEIATRYDVEVSKLRLKSADMKLRMVISR